MAGEVTRLYILFDADGRPYIKGLKGLENQSADSASKMEKRFKQAGDKMASALGGALKMAGAAGVVALGGLGAATIKAAANFEYEMSRIKANANGTAAEIEALQGTVIQLGKDTVFSAGEAAQAANELVKAGLSIGETMAALPGMLDLASAGELSVAQAATITANQLSVFNLKAKDATKVADVLALTANRSTTEVGLLGDSLAMSAAVAAQANLTLEDTAAALGILANNGLKGSDAGTSLKQMFMQLMGPSDKARQLMEDYGIAVYDANGEMLPFEEILREVAGGLEGATDQERDFALATIFGSDAVRAANILLREGADAYEDFRGEISKSGAASDIAAVKMDNLKGSWEQLKGSAETLMISVGMEALPAIREWVDGITEDLNAALEAGDWSLVLEKVSEALSSAAAEIAPVVGEIFAEAIGAALKGGLKAWLDYNQDQGAWEGYTDRIRYGRQGAVGLTLLDIASLFGGPGSGIARYDLNNAWTEGNQRNNALYSGIGASYKGPQNMNAMYSGIGGDSSTVAAAVKQQEELAAAAEEAAKALEEQQKVIDGYTSTLEGVLDSEWNPAQIWADAKGSLKEYLAEMKKHEEAWTGFKTNLETVAKTYGPTYGADVIMALAENPDALAAAAKGGGKIATEILDGIKAKIEATAELPGLAEQVEEWSSAAPPVEIPVKPTGLTDAWSDIYDFFAKKHIYIDTNLGGYAGANGYDAGGYIQPGINVVVNKTGKPEPVLNPQQWDAVQSLIAGVVKPSMDTAGPAAAAKDNTPILVRELRSVADRIEGAILDAERISRTSANAGRGR